MIDISTVGVLGGIVATGLGSMAAVAAYSYRRGNDVGKAVISKKALDELQRALTGATGALGEFRLNCVRDMGYLEANIESNSRRLENGDRRFDILGNKVDSLRDEVSRSHTEIVERVASLEAMISKRREG